ncbi:MAG: hypothetical protein SGARI_006427, partial [Bacillariaceae sp.]
MRKFVLLFFFAATICGSQASSVTDEIEPTGADIGVGDSTIASSRVGESCDTFNNASNSVPGGIPTKSVNSEGIGENFSSFARIPQPDPSIVGYPVSRHAPDRRKVDPVDTVRPEHAAGNPLGVPDYEWKARTELAAAYRSLYLAGLGSDQAA